ncbi:nucleotide-binding universal stress UspA family protein [Gelidibacter sediminis]|uniref:Nucleotide-binding universal stress UspA family protein n=1 Tax=Gelidibacter sediminis TaxID=1608710 RepID=A0A4R7Q7Z6_9FLAO|nr:universal stress protein [Gelidibacter sediminis]TDU43765.1 nucleotide-binding universal stress UspA family protein [Gelidibacter sediminis]
MKKILVPTDFSEQAENALKVAAQLARKHDSKIYLLHMLELPLQEVDMMNAASPIPEAMFFMKLAQQKFEDLLARDYLNGLMVHDIVKNYPSFSSIIDTCHEYNVDLIVMGSHGATGLKEMFIGSNTEKVVRTSDIPVLVIKNEHANFKVDRFVFASDFNKDNRETYKQATEVAKIFNAKMYLVMVNTANSFISTSEARKRINAFIKDSEFENYSTHIYNDDSVEQGILNFSKDIDADLIGISTHGRQGIAHFFNGSISEDLVNHSKRPVMTFKILT